MSVAIRTATRIQDQDDFGSTPGAGNDGYALTWDNGAGEFVLAAAGVTDHGALTGLSNDDHTGYALLAGRSGGQTLYGGADANDDITIHGTRNATRTTSYVLLQPSGGNVGIGTSTPGQTLEIVGGNISFGDDQASAIDRYIYGQVYTGSSYPRAHIRIRAANNGNQIYINADNSNYVRVGSGVGGISSYADFPINAQDGTLQFKINGVVKMQVSQSTGRVGIGTTSPATILHALTTDTATNAVTNVVTVGHNTSGTAAAGFGGGLAFNLQSSTTAAQDAARIQALWYEATHATRKADLVLTAYDTAEREGLRIRGAGSAPAIGFLGAAPAARIAHVADPAGGGTVDAEARSAINSILATLETFGFHATS